MITLGAMSFWSRGRSTQRDFLTGCDVRMWALSSHRLKKYFSKTTLVTDILGASLFRELEINFDTVSIGLEDFVQPDLYWLWCLGKIKAYSVIKEPFLHIDGDVFLGQPIPERVLRADIVAQNLENFSTDISIGYHIPTYRKAFTNLPIIVSDKLNRDIHRSWNFGVFGGNDLDFISNYFELVWDILQNNQIKDEYRDGAVISYFVEQYTLECLASQFKYPITSYLDYIKKEPKASYLNGPFVHMSGRNKHTSRSQKAIRGSLKIENPELFDRCNQYIDKYSLKDYP